MSLTADERELLAALPTQLVSLLDSVGTQIPDELPGEVRRLLPPAYPTDPEAEEAYVALTRGELLEHHRGALETLAATATATHLDEEQVADWLGALNDLRLVLGTILDVTEDDDEPDPSDPLQSEWSAYHYLGFLQSQLIDVLSGALPDPVPGADDLVPEDTWGEPPGGLRWDGTPRPDADEW